MKDLHTICIMRKVNNENNLFRKITFLKTIILNQMKKTLICLFAFSGLFANPQLDDMRDNH